MNQIQKSKDIAVKYLSYFLHHDYYSHDEAFDQWLDTTEAQQLLSGEDWKEDGSNGVTQKSEGDKINLFWSNGKYLGYCYKEDDGFYVFVFDENSFGSWSDYALRDIANTLTALNKDWNEQIRNSSLPEPPKP